MIIVDLPIRLVPKPRGGLGKYGNMTHYANNYGQWQTETARILKSTGFEMPETFTVLSLRIFLCGRGRPDVENMVGAWQDLLVKHGYLKDDNFIHLPEIHAKATKSTRDRLKFFICLDREDWIDLVTNYEEYCR